MDDYTEVCERLARVEQCLVNLEDWQAKFFKGLETVDTRTWEMKESFALWRGRESRAMKIISAITGIIAIIGAALISRFWGTHN